MTRLPHPSFALFAKEGGISVTGVNVKWKGWASPDIRFSSCGKFMGKGLGRQQPNVAKVGRAPIHSLGFLKSGEHCDPYARRSLAIAN